jgi:hypothetical protein
VSSLVSTYFFFVFYEMESIFLLFLYILSPLKQSGNLIYRSNYWPKDRVSMSIFFGGYTFSLKYHT